MRPSRARRVGGHGQAGAGREWQFVEREDERADDGMVEALVAVVVESHVVGGPAASELVAEGGELADVGQVPISGVSAGFDAQWSKQLNGRVAATDCSDQRAAGTRSAVTIASGVRPCAVGRPIGVVASTLSMSCKS